MIAFREGDLRTFCSRGGAKSLKKGKKGRKPSGEQQRRIPLPRWTEAIDVMWTDEQSYRVTTHSMSMT